MPDSSVTVQTRRVSLIDFLCANVHRSHTVTSTHLIMPQLQIVTKKIRKAVDKSSEIVDNISGDSYETDRKKSISN